MDAKTNGEFPASRLTKRELFAAMAMQAYITSGRGLDVYSPAEYDSTLSLWSVESADALLAALSPESAL